MTLNELKIGDKAIIDKIYDNEKVSKRLLALGCTKGTEIEVKRIAPLGDPIVVNFRGFDLAIRKETAKKIRVTKGGRRI